jgi:hypothetical protein
MVAALDRRSDDILQEIEQARVALADAVDRLAQRGDPKRLATQVKVAIRLKIESPQGRAALGACGAVVALLVIRRIRNSR